MALLLHDEFVQLRDVQEVDVEKLKEMVHVKDEDIAKLDKFVVRQEQHK